MIIHKCDRCGKESKQEKGDRVKCPEGWFTMRYSSGYGKRNPEYEICPDCRILLKIPADTDGQCEDVSERLIELIEEIAQDAVSGGP